MQDNSSNISSIKSTICNDVIANINVHLTEGWKISGSLQTTILKGFNNIEYAQALIRE